MLDALEALVSWETFLVALLVFGFAPGAVLRIICLAFWPDDPRSPPGRPVRNSMASLAWNVRCG